MYARKIIYKVRKYILKWFLDNQSGVAMFNVILLLLVLLHSAGYFHPYFMISIDVIVLAMLILFVLLFKARSRVLFAFTIFFLLVTMFFSFVRITAWAERSSIYVLQSLVLATIVLLLEKY